MKAPAKSKEFFVRALVLVAALLLFVLAAVVWSEMDDRPPSSAPAFPTAGLSIQRGDGQYFTYDVEVATTMEQETYGLMFRHELKSGHGMIFLYNPDQRVSMWMKNTYVPLDMLFVRADGTIVKIAAHTRPLDLTPISSEEPVRAVIEINAGDAEKNGFKTGDKVLYSAFSG